MRRGLGIHDYDQDARVLARRYQSEARLAATLETMRPGGRRVALAADGRRRPVVLSEMGGVACSDEAGTWGYDRAATGDALAERYLALAGTIRGCNPVAGFC
jgi:hypothetical protein